MKEKLAFLKENVALFSIAGYGIGLLYMFIFYYSFDIPIVNYLTLNDIILTTVTLVIPVAVTLLVLEYAFLGISRFFFIRGLNDSEKDRLTFITIVFIYITIYVSDLNNGLRTNPNMQFYVFFTSFAIIARIGSGKGKNAIKFALPVCLIGLAFGLNRLIESTKEGLGNKDVKFNYLGEIVITGSGSSLNYIGETSSTIFLYNFKKKISFAYEKANITKLKYSDKIEKEAREIVDIKDYVFKNAKFKLKSDTIVKPFEWNTHNYRYFWWTAEKNSIGLSKLMLELNNILEQNNFDLDEPTKSQSSLPIKININENIKEASDALNSGDFELYKKWQNESGAIEINLNKNNYTITINGETQKESVLSN